MSDSWLDGVIVKKKFRAQQSIVGLDLPTDYLPYLYLYAELNLHSAILWVTFAQKFEYPDVFFYAGISAMHANRPILHSWNSYSNPSANENPCFEFDYYIIQHNEICEVTKVGSFHNDRLYMWFTNGTCQILIFYKFFPLHI